MLNVYNKITPATGLHVAGICKIKIVPKEWLLSPLVIDFKTGRIISDVLLMEGKNFIEIDFVQDTYDYGEKPKSSKQGSFYEISLSGNTNSLTADDLQTLNTYRYHQFVAVIKDRQGRQKIVGNKDAGMVLQFSNKETTDKGGTQLIAIDMTMDMQNPAPFFALQLATPELLFIINSSTEIYLYWVSVPNATGYILQRASNAAFTTGLVNIYSWAAYTYTGAAMYHEDTSALPATTYYYRIKTTATGFTDSFYGTVSATTTA